ncbi:MAG: putative zinc metalloprotease [Patescibacteria group bacterium]|nr:MAG: putative zinc metalloprotease [Patescibacteria group bacterium]
MIIDFFIALFILVLIHELGHFLVAKLANIKVEEFGIGFPPALLKFKTKETVYSINAIPLGGFVKVYGEEYNEKVTKDKNRAFINKKPWQKIAVLTAGVIGNFLLGWVLISFLFTQGVPLPTTKVEIENIAKASPAETAGIKSKDIIKAVKTNEKTVYVESVPEFIEIINENKGKPITLIIERNKKELSITTIPRENPPKDQGALGVVLKTFEIKKYNWYQAPYYGLIESYNTTVMIVLSLKNLIIESLAGQADTKNLAGPIGIAKIVSDASAVGLNYYLYVVAILSFNLAVVNILPFPALDGGRIVFVLYEWITGNKVNKKVEHWVNAAGFAILITLVIIISIEDIKRFFL